MSSGRLEYAPFERPFAQPFRYGDRVLTHRSGVLLRRDGLVSEASPLAGHSSNSLDEVVETLESGDYTDEPECLAFAREGLDALAKPGSYPVRSNGLIPMTSLAESRLRLSELGRQGFTTIKVKISPQTLEDIPALVAGAEQYKFRLDANQSLTPASLETLVKALERQNLLSRVEYLEEPFTGVWDIASFRGFALPLAADETASPTLLESPNPPSVFIVKPSAMGGLNLLTPFLARLRNAQRKTVFTSTLESEPGRRALLAMLSREPRETCGLSTGSLFKENFLPDRPLWTEIPAPSEAELRYQASLSWKECP